MGICLDDEGGGLVNTTPHIHHDYDLLMSPRENDFPICYYWSPSNLQDTKYERFSLLSACVHDKAYTPPWVCYTQLEISTYSTSWLSTCRALED